MSHAHRITCIWFTHHSHIAATHRNNICELDTAAKPKQTSSDGRAIKIDGERCTTLPLAVQQQTIKVRRVHRRSRQRLTCDWWSSPWADEVTANQQLTTHLNNPHTRAGSTEERKIARAPTEITGSSFVINIITIKRPVYRNHNKELLLLFINFV